MSLHYKVNRHRDIILKDVMESKILGRTHRSKSITKVKNRNKQK